MPDVTNIRLVYLDPPYGSKQEDTYYGIGETFDEYLEYMRLRLNSIKATLHPDGANVLIHLDYKAVHYVKVLADKIFGRDNFQNEIIWCYASPSVAKSRLPRKHDTILCYGIGSYPFNQPLTPYVGKLKVGGKTAWKQDADEKEYLAKGKKLEDWWTDIPSLCRNEPEKVGYPTQKPRKLMDRIVTTYSDPGHATLDPFCGSGSFIESAIANGRLATGVDVSADAIAKVTKRIDELQGKTP
jgi:DNA modification methylase